jgi:hypothetical protein
MVPRWLANLCNRVNDSDLTWVGFRSLRPTPVEHMTARVVVWLCVVYCPLSAAVGYGITYLMMAGPLGRRAPQSLPWIMAAAMGIIFALMQVLLARAWNLRATQLRAGKSRAVPGAS